MRVAVRKMLIPTAGLACAIGLLAGIAGLSKRDDVPSSSHFRIEERGRLKVDRAALPRRGPLILLLGLTDSSEGSDERAVRIVSADGRRLDTTARRRPESGSESRSDLRLELDPAFLTKGLYMIEVDAKESHPLNLRRYVLELQ